MELERAMVCGKFAWKLAELTVLNSHLPTKPSDSLSVQTICSSSSVKTAICWNGPNIRSTKFVERMSGTNVSTGKLKPFKRTFI